MENEILIRTSKQAHLMWGRAGSSLTKTRALFTWREVTLGTNDRIPDSIKNEFTEVLVDDGKIFTLHKGECRQLFEALNGGESCHWPWQEMKELPFELMVNIGLPVENVQKQFKDYRESGYID